MQIQYNETIEFTVKQSSLTRIDKLLSLSFEELTRNKICGLIDSGNVLVNGNICDKNYKVKIGDVISVTIPEPEQYEAVPENIPLDIVYEDEFLVVVNKPKGMVVHPAHGNLNGTLVNALLYHCKDSLSGINGIMRPGIVHRIDKDTSGLLVIAKNDFAHNSLAAQFKTHSIEREYRAIVVGNLKEESGVIDKPIGRHPNDRKKMCCTSRNSKNAVTHYEVIDRFNGFTYIKCNLETGRTHQIRVHMSNSGHFILGDLVYGKKVNNLSLNFEGQCLHAKTLGFVHPDTNEFMRFDSDLPEYFENILNKISKK